MGLGTSTSRRGSAQRGFTLIEVLVALAIVAVTLGAGIKAAGSLTNNAQRATEVSAAQWCATNQLAGQRLNSVNKQQFPGAGTVSFECEQLGRRYPGKLVIAPTPNPNFRRIDAQVFNDAGEPLLTLSTILSRY